MNGIRPVSADAHRGIACEGELPVERPRTRADIADRVPCRLHDQAPAPIVTDMHVDRERGVACANRQLETAVSAGRGGTSKKEFLDGEVPRVRWLLPGVAGEIEPRLQSEHGG